MESLADDLKSADPHKEAVAVNKSILVKHGQWVEPVLKKRVQPESIDLNPSNSKNMRLGEKYTKEAEFFQNTE